MPVTVRPTLAASSLAHRLLLVHGWNYRWFLTESFLEQASLSDEFDFTTQMIYKNFSNYSAWHRRSVIVERLVEQGLAETRLAKLMADDLKLLKSVYFTEPADQSAWFYLRWLLAFADRHTRLARDWTRSELQNIEELLAIEPDAPLALFTWVHLARRTSLDSDGAGGERDRLQRRLCERLQRLCVLDPMRAHLYRSMLPQ